MLEADLLAAGSRNTIAEFEKDCRDLARLLTGDGGVGELDRQKANSTVRRWIDKVTGMWHLHAEVDPETGAKLWTAIDAQLDTVKQRDGNAEVPLEQLTVIALVEVVGATRRETVTTRPRGVRTRRPGDACRWAPRPAICETSNGIPLPADTIRRLCCEAAIIPIVMGADGETLAVGASSASPTVLNAKRCVPCTAPAPTPTVTSRSTTARSTMSSPGSDSASRTWTICCHCARNITTTCTKDDGNSPCRLIARSPSTDPTARTTSPEAPSTDTRIAEHPAESTTCGPHVRPDPRPPPLPDT